MSSTPAPPSRYRVVFTAATTSANVVYLYDSTSNAAQQLVSLASGAPPEARFVASDKIAYSETTNQGAGRITMFDLASRSTNVVVNANGYIPAFAYSHDGTMLAYLVHDPQGNASLHARRSGQEQTYKLNAIPGRGVGRDDEVHLEYSADDKYLLMVDTFVGNQGQAPQTGQFLVIRTGDLSVAFVPPSGVSANATMATWSRHMNRLYYRDAVGVRTWDAEVQTVGTLATGLHWYDPVSSPDDRSLAFTDIDSHFVPRVKLYDLQGQQPSGTAAGSRSHPIFVTADALWYLEEQACTSECLGGPSQTSGKVLAYDLKSRSETALPFSDIQSLSQFAVFSY